MFQCVSALCYWGQPRFPRIQKSIRLALGVVMLALPLEHENGFKKSQDSMQHWTGAFLNCTDLACLFHITPVSGILAGLWPILGATIPLPVNCSSSSMAVRQPHGYCPQPSLIRWQMTSEAWSRTRASWNLPLSTPHQLPRAGRHRGGGVVTLCSPF